jgi:hypothetical protein
MKNSPLTAVLLAILAISALLSVVLCWLFISHTRELRALQFTVNQINYARGMAPALVQDAAEYSKRNPEMVRTLESVGIKVTATNAPGTKPK